MTDANTASNIYLRGFEFKTGQVMKIRHLVFLVVLSLSMTACNYPGFASDQDEIGTKVAAFQTQTAAAGDAAVSPPVAQETQPVEQVTDTPAAQAAPTEDTPKKPGVNALVPGSATFSDDGRDLVVENETVRVVFDKVWGGAIREISIGGENMVNEYDGGRLIGVSFYDGATTEGNTDHPADTGWNPTPSDWLNNTNNPISYEFENNTLHIQTRYIQWFPLDKGGGEGNPVPTDVVVDTWFSFVNTSNLMHVRYTMTYEGSENHVLAQQEFPFAYIRSPFDHFVTYAGDRPWTNDAIFIDGSAPVFPDHGDTRSSEHWAGFVNEKDIGLLMYAPQNYGAMTYNYFDNQPPIENSCFYLLPYAFFDLVQGTTKEISVFFYAGDWHDARESFHELEESIQFPDILPPLGFLDSIYPGAAVSGATDVAGWALDNAGISSVEIYLDGQKIGEADYGHPRPDVESANPTISSGPDVGYVFSWDTTQFSNGTHSLRVEFVDVGGNRSIAEPGEMTISIDN